MNTLSLTTPALMFSAVSLILLAYTNRFLAYASIIRNLYAEYQKNKDFILIDQIKNLKKRLKLIRLMQILGVLSLFFSMFSILLLYMELNLLGGYAFVLGLLSMIGSLVISVWEIQISVRALDLHLKGMENH
ncbi:MAG: DUF2721 domain-containing protein [Salinivirgaceae bacterium]|nr:DUF2721 domain-containing protein [Salinivirgaceae bacterium]